MGKKIALGTVAGFIGLMIGGFLIYGLLMKGDMEAMAAASGGCMKAEPDAVPMIVATVIQALFFTLVLYKFNVNTLVGGAVAAVWVNILISAMYDLWFMGSFDWITSSMVIKDFLANIVIVFLGGAAIGWVFGKVK